MTGLNSAKDTVSGAVCAPSTVTTSWEDDLLPSPAGTTTLICLSLSNRICPRNPSHATTTFVPESCVPSSVEMDPGTAGPTVKVPGLTRTTVGGGGVDGAAVTTNVIGIAAKPVCGPASTVRI